MGLNLPPINGVPYQSASASTPDGAPADPDLEEDFDIASLPFKPDYLYTSADEVKQLLIDGTKKFGSPAASLTWGIDGNRMLPQLTAGIDGEKMTAKVLDRMSSEIPEMFVYHSLSWPNSTGDTDHIVVYGDLIVIVDSKRWKSSRKYSVTQSGSIIRGTVPFPSGKVKIAGAIASWKKLLPSAKVKGTVCIAQEKIHVSRDKNWYRAPFRLVEHERLEEYLLETFAKHTGSKSASSRTLISLALLLVKPRNRAEEIIRVGGEKRSNDTLRTRPVVA